MPRRRSGTGRRCIGCMVSKEKDDLIRIVREEGGLSPDLASIKAGRGAYLCRNIECFEKERKRNSFARAFRKEVKKEDMDNLLEALKEEISTEQ